MIIEKQLKILEKELSNYINNEISTREVVSIINNNEKISKPLKKIISECSIGKEINKMVYFDTLDSIKSKKTKRFLNSYIFINNYKLVEESEEYIEEIEELEEENSNNLSSVVDDIDKMFFRELKMQPKLSEEETVDLIKKYQETGNVKYKNEIISGHLRLVIYIAKKYVNKGELLDLIQEGSLGLGKAVEKFNLERKCKLSTYATWWIRQSITRYLEDKGDIIKKPSHVFQSIKKLNHAITKYQNENSGMEPTLEELSKYTGYDIETIIRLKSYDINSVSLNKEVGENEGDSSELMDFISDEKSEESIYNNVYNNDLKDKIEELFDEVFPVNIERGSKRDSNIKIRKVLKHRFGLFGETPKTLEEVAPMLNVTRERVRQIEAKGLQRLRRNKSTKSLKLFLN